MRASLLVLCGLVLSAVSGWAKSVRLDSAAAIVDAMSRNDTVARQFAFEATVTLAGSREAQTIPVSDRTGSVVLGKAGTEMFNFSAEAGETFLFSGVLTPISPDNAVPYVTAARRIGRATPPDIPLITPDELQSGSYDYRPVRIRGVIRDILQDEIDPDFCFLILRCQDTFIPFPIRSNSALAAKGDNLIGAEIDVTGICSPTHACSRQQMIGRLVNAIKESDIRVSRPDAHDEFSVPELERLLNLSPAEITRQDRHRVSGNVIAVLHGNALVVKTPSGRFVGAALCGKNAPPTYGQSVDVAGFPECDLYRVNLSRAIWRPRKDAAELADTPIAFTSAAELVADDKGRPRFKPSAHGATVRIRGLVRTLPPADGVRGLLDLDCGGFIMPVDASAQPDALEGVVAGCELEVTGVCVLESENWRPNLIFPKITRALVVPRRPSDVRILAHPSWWTPGHLLALVGILTAALLGFFVWNASLRILAQRRGRELFRSQIAKVSSELRVNERTRLAVELHDSITQNLTGVTLQLDAAASARPENPSAADALLGVARRTLQSCLDELRSCLWDLRSEALEEPDFNRAIRIALQHVSARTDIAVRFNISRARMSDATAHAILRIIRELTANAIRHGKATKVRIAGEMDANEIRFAVTDNGRGFDPSAVPGPDNGHFGLAGIRERLRELRGTLAFTVAPGGGMRAKVTIGLSATAETT